MNVIDWLLDADPAIRWQAMRDLTNAPPSEVAAERSRVANEGWGAQLLALQQPGGDWGGDANNLEWNAFLALHLLRELGLDPLSEAAMRAVGLVRDNLSWHWWGRAFFHGEVEPIPAVIDCLRGVMEAHGLTLHVASDRQHEDDLFGNVGAYMWACQYGIGLLENRLGATALNDNVLIELGSMMVIGRRCAMLKDTTAAGLPSDLTAQLYKSVDFDDLDAVSAVAHRWVAEDLGLLRCAHCRPQQVEIRNVT